MSKHGREFLCLSHQNPSEWALISPPLISTYFYFNSPEWPLSCIRTHLYRYREICPSYMRGYGPRFVSPTRLSSSRMNLKSEGPMLDDCLLPSMAYNYSSDTANSICSYLSMNTAYFAPLVCSTFSSWSDSILIFYSIRYAVKDFCFKNGISPDQLKERLKIFDASLAAVQVNEIQLWVLWLSQ